MSCSTSTADVIGPHHTKFFTKEWYPPAGTPTVAGLLFVHGFVEHIQRYDHVFPKYAEAGIAVFAYDQRGFGQTAFFTPKHSQGVTSWKEQFEDLDFFAKSAREKFPDVPLEGRNETDAAFGVRATRGVSLRHSMGGGEVLGYPTRRPALPAFEACDFRGVVASSPLLRQAKSVRAPAFVVRAGSVLGRLSATLPINAKVKPEDTCRDVDVQQAYANDRLCKQVGTFRGVADMLLGGEGLVSREWKHWPRTDLPLLIVHGEADKVSSPGPKTNFVGIDDSLTRAGRDTAQVTDHEASREFVERVKSLGNPDATYKGFEGFYHEMHNEPGDDKWREIGYIVDWIVARAKRSPSSTGGPNAQAPTASTTTPTPAGVPIATTQRAAPTIQVEPASPVPQEAAPVVEARESKL
ncbi:hypothetical protein JCM10212_004100 [Sporobolomyces blumeae]